MTKVVDCASATDVELDELLHCHMLPLENDYCYASNR